MQKTTDYGCLAKIGGFGMPRRGIVADPEDMEILSSAFQEAWANLRPEALPEHRRHAHREWLAKLVLGLSSSGYVSNLSAMAAEQFRATSPTGTVS